MSFLTCDMIDISRHDPLENDTRTKTQASLNEFDDDDEEEDVVGEERDDEKTGTRYNVRHHPHPLIEHQLTR